MLQSWGSVAEGSNGYELYMQKSASDADFRINGFEIVGGSNWDPALSVNVPTTAFQIFGGPTSEYTLGTLITGEQDWYFQSAEFWGLAPAGVAAGLYDFSLNVLGGPDTNSNSILASIGFTIEVFPTLNFSLTASSPNPVNSGQTFDLSMSLTNNTAGRTLRTTTWYVSGFFRDGIYGGDELQFQDFLGDWFDVELETGINRTGLHSRWSVPGSAPNGSYLNFNGLLGGLHRGDNLTFTPSYSVQAVPEPATMAVGIAAAAAYIRRRRK